MRKRVREGKRERAREGEREKGREREGEREIKSATAAPMTHSPFPHMALLGDLQ